MSFCTPYAIVLAFFCYKKHMEILLLFFYLYLLGFVASPFLSSNQMLMIFTGLVK